MEFARLELSERLGAVRRNLPARAGQPFIRPYVPEELRTEEFFSVSLISPLSMNDLRDRAETWLVPRFLAISGVADAELRELCEDVIFNRRADSTDRLLEAVLPAESFGFWTADRF